MDLKINTTLQLRPDGSAGVKPVVVTSIMSPHRGIPVGVTGLLILRTVPYSRMPDNLDELIENTRKRVDEMRRVTEETQRLLGETKKAEEQLAEPTEHIQSRHTQV